MWRGAYQVPADGQAPEPPVVQLRVIVPSDAFAIEKLFPDFELAVIVYVAAARPENETVLGSFASAMPADEVSQFA